MTLLCDPIPTIILGTVSEVKPMSAQHRLERRKYMRAWRGESGRTARMLSRFLSTMTRYMDRDRDSKARTAAVLDPLRVPEGGILRHL